MRVTAYTLLILGFCWLLFWCGSFHVWALTRRIAINHFAMYPNTRQYTGDEMCNAIRSFVAEYRDRAPGPTLPAAMMLAGGILLDVAGKRRLDARLFASRSDEQAPASASPPPDDV